VEGNWWQNLKANLLDPLTWKMLIYMVLQMPLGVIYFTIITFLITLSLGFIASPILQVALGIPMSRIGDTLYYLPIWAMPLVALGGFLLFTVTLHISRGVGALHGQYAKRMLVN